MEDIKEISFLVGLILAIMGAYSHQIFPLIVGMVLVGFSIFTTGEEDERKD